MWIVQNLENRKNHTDMTVFAMAGYRARSVNSSGAQTSHGTPADSSEIYGWLRHHPTTDHVASEARPQTGI